MTTPLKIVVVGDGAVGKTCMLISYTEGKFPKEYVPTVFDNYEAQIGPYICSIWDTGGQEGYARIRTLSYPKTDVFLLCYSVVNHPSYVNVRDRWMPEISPFLSPLKAIVILVGTKTDLRTDPKTLDLLYAEGKSPLSSNDGFTLAEEIGAAAYVECSALTRDRIYDVFKQTFDLTGKHIKNRSKNPEAAKLAARERQERLPPPLPKAQRAPHIEVVTSSMGKNLESLNNPSALTRRYVNVQFVVREEEEKLHSPKPSLPEKDSTSSTALTATTCSFRQFSAHKMVLAAASPLFARIFQLEDPANNVNSQDFIGRDMINNGGIRSISSIREDSFQIEESPFPVRINTEKWGRLVLKKCMFEHFPASNQRTVLTLSSHITDELWRYVLEFLYSGQISLKLTARFKHDRKVLAKRERELELVEKLVQLAEELELKELADICRNIEQEEDWLNPSIGTWLNDRLGESFRQRFFPQAEDRSQGGEGEEDDDDDEVARAAELDRQRKMGWDVVFAVGSANILAHRLIFVGRCPQVEYFLLCLEHLLLGRKNARVQEEKQSVKTHEMAREFGVDLDDCSVSDDGQLLRVRLDLCERPETFRSFLQYLYTDHVGIESLPFEHQMDLMQLASRFGEKRLVSLCELYICKSIEKATCHTFDQQQIDIVDTLHLAQQFQANQLVDCILHFLASNHVPMRIRPEWDKLTEEDLDRIELRKWPPQSYMDEVAAYEKWLAEKKSSASSSSYSSPSNALKAMFSFLFKD